MLCRHISLLFSKRLDTILLRHRIRKHPTRCGLIFFFHSGDRIQKYPDSLLSSPNGCGLKPYPEKKKSRYVWTAPSFIVCLLETSWSLVGTWNDANLISTCH